MRFILLARAFLGLAEALTGQGRIEEALEAAGAEAGLEGA
jgi:hypothetical protein